MTLNPIPGVDGARFGCLLTKWHGGIITLRGRRELVFDENYAVPHLIWTALVWNARLERSERFGPLCEFSEN